MAYFEDNSISHDITTSAGFRAWASKIHKALEEVGLKKTEDTGQINLETVETPIANSTYAGYEIWRFNDTEQSTRPIYMKIEYGRGLAAARPAVRMTYGRGSNGSGTLTTPSEPIVHAPTATPSGNGLIYASLYKGAFSLISTCLTSSGGGSAIFLHAERLRDPELKPLDAFIVARQANALENAPGAKRLFRGGIINAWAGAEETEVAHLPATVISGGVGVPARSYLVGPISTAPFIGLTGFGDTDVASGDIGTIKVQGENITYKRMACGERSVYGTNFTGYNIKLHNPCLPRME